MNKHLQQIRQIINIMKILIVPHELTVKCECNAFLLFFFVN